MGTVGGARHVRARDLPALRPTAERLMGQPRPRRRRRGWRHDGARNVWTHTPTGLAFSGHMVAYYGWEAMPELCVEIIGWRAFIAGLPITDLRRERELLLAEALACEDDDDMRRLTLRWSLWHEETDTVTGGNGGK